MSLLLNLFAARRVRSPRQVDSKSWEDREKILESDVNLFCWKRPVDPLISAFLIDHLESFSKPISFNVTPETLIEKIECAKKEWGTHEGSTAELFWQDVNRLVGDFMKLSQAASATFHLKVVTNNACTKFHVDGYSQRLFTTYVGKGTEWLDEETSNRKALGSTNESIVKDPSRIRRMESFEVGILKGEVPNKQSETRGIVHKSPDIEQSGEKRIILRVDI